MAKTKVVNIDDSKPAEEEVKKSSVKEGSHRDELVEKLRAELGIEEEAPKIEAKSEKKEAQETKKEEKKEAPKEGPKKHRSKKYLEASVGIEKTKPYSLKEAVGLVKKASYSKFEGTIEAHILTNIKNLRGSVTLPFSSGKKVRILAFGSNADKSGADIVGNDEKIAEIAQGKIDFDYLLTTPDWMGKIAPLAKVLGPKGLMPNPKNGTITDDLAKAVSELQGGKTEYRTEQNGKVMHLSIGKVNQEEDQLSQNIKVLVQTIGKTKIKKFVLAPTMGTSLRLDLGSI